MNRLAPQATVIFRRLMEGLKAIGNHRRIDNAPSFMAVSVEITDELPAGMIVAVTHYYEQNGDLMADPDMTFFVAEDGVYPLTFRQDNLGVSQEAAWWKDGQWKVQPKLQADLASFANQWMRNIQEQQRL